MLLVTGMLYPGFSDFAMWAPWHRGSLLVHCGPWWLWLVLRSCPAKMSNSKLVTVDLIGYRLWLFGHCGSGGYDIIVPSKSLP